MLHERSRLEKDSLVDQLRTSQVMDVDNFVENLKSLNVCMNNHNAYTYGYGTRAIEHFRYNTFIRLIKVH